MKEVFVPINFNSNYEISNRGRLRSKYNNNRLFTSGFKYLKGLYSKHGYHMYSLGVIGGRYGERKVCMAHRLVYEHFIGPIPDGMEIDHLDNNRSNNHVDNLEVVTHKENIIRSYSRGREVKRGKDHHLYGSKASKSTRNKMRQAKLGCNHPKFSGWYVVGGKKYPTPGEPAEILGVSSKTVSRWCKLEKNGCKFLAI